LVKSGFRHLWFGCIAASLWGAATRFYSADFDPWGAGFPGAGDAATAGASAATRRGLDGAALNPAALSGDQVWLGVGWGSGGDSASGLAEAEALIPGSKGLTFGLAADGIDAGGVGNAQNQAEGKLSAAFEVTPEFSFGVRLLSQEFWGQGGGLAFDGGALWTPFSSPDGRLSLGWWGSELGSTFAWNSGAPVTERLGAEWEFKGAATLDTELDVPQYSAPGPSRQTWRWGATVPLGAVEVSAGTAWEADQAHPLFTAGAATPVKGFFGHGILRYAAVFRAAGADGPDVEHRVSLEWALPSMRPGLVAVRPLRIVYVPGTHRVQSATLELAVEGDQAHVRSWELEIRDKDGNLLRTLSGDGPAPAAVVWDGKDALGVPVPDADQVTYRLKLKNESGEKQSRDAYALDARIEDAALAPIASAVPVAPEAPQLNLRGMAIGEGTKGVDIRWLEGGLQALPTQVPTQVPTLVPTQVPTLVPTQVPTLVPTPEAATVEPAALAGGLAVARFPTDASAIPGVFLAPPTRIGGGGSSHGPGGGGGLSWFLDVFQWGEDRIEPGVGEARLAAFYKELAPYRRRRLRLSGWVAEGEPGGDVLSRRRVEVLSRLLVEKADFTGEFILDVNGAPRAGKGVAVDVLKK